VNPVGASAALSVVVPVTGDGVVDVAAFHGAACAALAATRRDIECLYVLDGDRPAEFAALERLRAAGDPLRIVRLGRAFGGGVAVQAGIGHASGETILVLPPRGGIDPAAIPALVGALDTADVAAARVSPASSGFFRRLQSRIYHGMASRLLGYRGGGLGGGARAFRRRLLDEIPLYGDRYRFLPLLAWRQGFRVVSIDVRPAPGTPVPSAWGPKACLGGMLDLLAVFFLLRFTKRPLRFFGAIGTGLFSAGALLSAWLFGLKFLHHQRLADRPLLLLAALLVVLGVQVVALGLIGEIVIYTHAREIREYSVDEVVG
jgi:glycosyltransferase involved in cell wall biosynthesis